MNILIVAGWVLLSAVLLIACGAPPWIATRAIFKWDDSDRRDQFPRAKVLACAGAFFVALTGSIYVLGSLIPNDAASHCGPGTHYLETGSGKYHSWICVAD